MCLAVGLGSNVYFWTEVDGAKPPESLNSPLSGHITCLSFSSKVGARALLAIGRADGRVTIWNAHTSEPSFDANQPSPISCLSFASQPSQRPSFRDDQVSVQMELLATGDEAGYVYLYAVESPSADNRALYNWQGAMNVLCRLNCHIQQVCGIAWSINNESLATGGNDNSVFVFDVKSITCSKKGDRSRPGMGTAHANATTTAASASRLPAILRRSIRPSLLPTTPDAGLRMHPPPATSYPTLPPSCARHTIPLKAAVKAIAFAPFCPMLLALGAGSNDRGIHVHHAASGAKLAAIDCAAQVTSLTWSTTRSELAATFGFAQPEHRVRLAVYSWPACDVLVRLEWPGEERALWAVAFPGGPDDFGRGTEQARRRGGNNSGTRGKGRPDEGSAQRRSRTAREGCLVVAASDASIKFHEVWSDGPGGASVVVPGYGTDGVAGRGCLGRSEVLEEELGIERLGLQTIR